jgi:ABC-type lipoprotein export system ATPase subunit
MDLLKKINEDMETTIIVVTHRGSLASYADKIVKMQKGAIISVK